jgi:hypothetical protein
MKHYSSIVHDTGKYCKRKALNVATNFEMIQACENDYVNKNKSGRCYISSSSTHFTIL